MDCTNARLLLHIAGRDGQELIAADHKLLDQHLEACPDCAAFARGEQRFDEVVGRAMNAVTVPGELKGRILDLVSAPARPRFWPWLSAAAAVLIAVGLGVAWYMQPAAKLDVASFHFDFDTAAANADSVEQWFASQGLTVPAPRQFNYDLLESIDVQSVQGKKLPHLLFKLDRRAAVAHVYVVPSQMLDDAPELGMTIPGSRHNIVFLPHPRGAERPDFYFMVVYTSGASVNAFLK